MASTCMTENARGLLVLCWIFTGSVDFAATEGFHISAVVLGGDVAPGPVGGTYSGARTLSMNSSGDVVFSTDIMGGTANSGVFVDSGGIVRVADQCKVSPNAMRIG